MKKKLVTVLLAILLCINVLPFNSAPNSIIAYAATGDETASPMSEVTEWYVRIHNGKLQKRLWSVTYGEWLTDWIDVE